MGCSAQTIVGLAGKFITTLMPISIAYHLVRSLSFLLINIQFFILLDSNLFGFGWDMLSPWFARSSPNIGRWRKSSLGILLPLSGPIQWRLKFIATVGALRAANIPCSY